MSFFQMHLLQVRLHPATFALPKYFLFITDTHNIGFTQMLNVWNSFTFVIKALRWPEDVAKVMSRLNFIRTDTKPLFSVFEFAEDYTFTVLIITELKRTELNSKKRFECAYLSNSKNDAYECIIFRIFRLLASMKHLAYLDYHHLSWKITYWETSNFFQPSLMYVNMCAHPPLLYMCPHICLHAQLFDLECPPNSGQRPKYYLQFFYGRLISRKALLWFEFIFISFFCSIWQRLFDFNLSFMRFYISVWRANE